MFNDMALVEDPDYARAHYRKCTILEKKGEFKRAVELAEAAIDQFSHEEEYDVMNRNVVPKFQELIIILKTKMPFEEEMRLNKLQKEVDAQLDASEPHFDWDFATGKE